MGLLWPYLDSLSTYLFRETMSHQAEVEQVDIAIEELEKCIDLKNRVLKLERNRDFKELIMTQLFEKEPVRLTAILHEDGVETEKVQREIEMIGGLRRWFRGVVQRGRMAENAIDSYRAEAEDLRQQAIFDTQAEAVDSVEPEDEA